MASHPLFRFVQTTNLELDRFCTATGELTPAQGRALIDAPFRAAERVFETALREQADLILLAGGVFVGRHSSTWGASFLARQCDRVGRHGIEVVWVDTNRERERCWPRFLPLPDNLRITHADDAQLLLLGGGARIPVTLQTAVDPATLLARGAARSSARLPAFRIGVLTQAPGNVHELDRPIDYWAVAAGDTAQTWPVCHGMARSAGTAQPRHPAAGACGGCLLVDVGPGYSLSTQFIETNSIRYHVERIAVDDATNWEGFRRDLHQRADAVLAQTAADAVDFRFTIHGHGPVIERLTLPETADALRNELAAAAQSSRPSAWVASPQPEPDAVQESRWQREGSPFGALVRALEGLPVGNEQEVDLTGLLPDHVHAVDPAATHVPRPHYQTALKSQARRLGAQALTRAGR